MFALVIFIIFFMFVSYNGCIKFVSAYSSLGLTCASCNFPMIVDCASDFITVVSI